MKQILQSGNAAQQAVQCSLRSFSRPPPCSPFGCTRIRIPKNTGILMLIVDAETREVSLDSIDVQFPKLGVLNVISFSRFWNQSLAVEPPTAGQACSQSTPSSVFLGLF